MYICRMLKFCRVRSSFLSVCMCLFLATMLALSMKAGPKATPETDPKTGPVVGVAFRNASAAGFVDIQVRVDRTLGGEFRASAMGHEQAAVAFDPARIWFWIRSYNPRRYYLCNSEDADRVGLAPALRPLFMRCVCGAEFLWREHPRDGEMSMEDGEYSVVVVFEEGYPRLQRYLLDGREVLSLEFIEYQKSAGLLFPSMIRLEMEGSSPLDIDMGEVEINPPDAPKTAPPEGIRRHVLQP